MTILLVPPFSRVTVMSVESGYRAVSLPFWITHTYSPSERKTDSRNAQISANNIIDNIRMISFFTFLFFINLQFCPRFCARAYFLLFWIVCSEKRSRLYTAYGAVIGTYAATCAFVNVNHSKIVIYRYRLCRAESLAFFACYTAACAFLACKSKPLVTICVPMRTLVRPDEKSLMMRS